MATERDEVCGGIASDESEDWWWCIVPMVIGSHIAIISFSDESLLCLCCTGVFVVAVFVFTLTSPIPRRRYSPLSRCVVWFSTFLPADLLRQRPRLMKWSLPDSAEKSDRQTNRQRQTDRRDERLCSNMQNFGLISGF